MYPIRHLNRNRVLVVNVDRSRTTSSLKVGVLNVRSLSNMSAAILQLIMDESLDLFATFETWHDSAESPSVIASTPSDYLLFERARLRRSTSGNFENESRRNLCFRSSLSSGQCGRSSFFHVRAPILSCETISADLCFLSHLPPTFLTTK